jgi:peptidyl-prolyl cis-trans isomerase SurA
MRKTFLLLLISITVILSPKALHAAEALIAATVNDRAIAVSDLRERMRLIAVSSGLQNTPEIREKLKTQVINSLIEEQIKLQEADKLGIEITAEEIEAGLSQVAKQNNMSVDQFRGAVIQSGVDIKTMEEQVRAEIAWTKIIQKKVRSKVVVSDADVQNIMERFNRLDGTQEYLIAEIMIPVDTADSKSEGNVKKISQDLVLQMKAGKAPFSAVARQFSKTAGAQNGGDVGWIQKGQLPEELDTALEALESGKITDPIRTPKGYHILLLRDKRTISPENIPEETVIRNQIGTQRLNRLGQQYLLGLQSTALIEKRI